ncbi:hypothetical protein Vdis_2274 [Vulcanisaeta distributa DSM 14429]|uniref:Uncharacterized protein n=1 Tax=Vulcanisaeta distributa (strain DSM 14429 / JCM 11212 / NBRC 100878 / IC-017) TaxID=572478 RepID=E1QQN0_VULDI|nr:hypothetical protein Vdis_2274 [Vulcanisaeta distributa DSM 14429]
MENILMNSINKNELKCMQKARVSRYCTIEEEKRFKSISNEKQFRKYGFSSARRNMVHA